MTQNSPIHHPTTEATEISDFLQKSLKAPIVAIDTETIGFRVRSGEDTLMGLSIAYGDSNNGKIEAQYFPIAHEAVYTPRDENLTYDEAQLIREAVKRYKRVVFHNATFDLASLHTRGFSVTGQIYDTGAMAHLFNENLPSRQLDWLGKYFLQEGKMQSFELDTFVKLGGWRCVPAGFMREYGAQDARLTLRLFRVLYRLLDQQDLLFLLEPEGKFIRLLSDMERIGVAVDLDKCNSMAEIAEKRMAELEEKLGFNPASPQQVGEVLVEKLGLPVLAVTPGGKPSFNKAAMESYDQLLETLGNDATNHLARDILEYRGWSKANSVSYRGYPALASPRGIIHPEFRFDKVKTGRLSCGNPNLQQIPRKSEKAWNGQIKSLFIPRPGYVLLEFDFKNLEFRLASLYSRDKKLLDGWRDSNRDVFSEIATDLHITRDQAKTFSYAMIYGAGPEKIGWMLRLQPSQTKTLFQNWRLNYPNLLKKMKEVNDVAEERKYIKYWTGRRRHFTRFNEDETHKAFNSLVQGGGAELVKRAILRTQNLSGKEEARMVLTVHDSVLWEVRDGYAQEFTPKVRTIMEDVVSESEFFSPIPFPVESKIWGQ